MLKIILIDKNYSYLDEVKHLYKIAFPKNERDPLSHLLLKNNEEHDFVAFEDEHHFIGFACLLTFKNITHISYLAINPNYRKHGYGHILLTLISSWKENNLIFVDVEKDDKNANNYIERIKRIDFYLHNGYLKTNISFQWKDVDYELLSFNGILTQKQFDDFWHHFEFFEDWGKFLYETFRKKQ